MDNENPWHDAVDHCPQLVCEVELKGGKIIEAFYIMGSWETLEGECIYPERFRFKRAMIYTPTYNVDL